VGREYEPTVGQWYEDLENEETFQVLKVDEDKEIVEIQHLDGDIEEFDVDSWAETRPGAHRRAGRLVRLEGRERARRGRGRPRWDWDEDDDEDDEDDDDDDDDPDDDADREEY
jgi:hypothetical protein